MVLKISAKTNSMANKNTKFGLHGEEKKKTTS